MKRLMPSEEKYEKQKRWQKCYWNFKYKKLRQYKKEKKRVYFIVKEYVLLSTKHLMISKSRSSTFIGIYTGTFRII